MNTTSSIMFVADTMLGKLARYLRIMGYDTLYQSKYSDQKLAELVKEGRIFLSRNNAIIRNYSHALFISHDLVKDQLRELDNSVLNVIHLYLRLN